MWTRSLLLTAALGLALGLASLACGPSAAPAAQAPTADPFAVVRATSQAAYASGRAHLDRGELDQALVDLDTAKTNDPDNRQDVQQALDETVHRLQSLTPTAAARPAQPAQASPVPQRTIVVATLGAAPAATPMAAAPSPSPSTSTSASAGLVDWRDPRARFSLGVPAAWTTADPPHSMVGTPAVEFRDPTGQAELDVAVDAGGRAVSPELYAASLELAMQQQVPGYASEQAVPGSLGGSPSIRRVFTFSQRDAAGREHQARAIQVVALRGTTAYVVSGSAPADQFAGQFADTFDEMVDSFRFG